MLKPFRRSSATPMPSARERALAESRRTLFAAGEAEGRWLDASMDVEDAREANETPERIRSLERIADSYRAEYERATAAEERALEAALPYM